MTPNEEVARRLEALFLRGFRDAINERPRPTATAIGEAYATGYCHGQAVLEHYRDGVARLYARDVLTLATERARVTR